MSMLREREKAMRSRGGVFVAVCLVLFLNLSERGYGQDTGSAIPIVQSTWLFPFRQAGIRALLPANRQGGGKVSWPAGRAAETNRERPDPSESRQSPLPNRMGTRSESAPIVRSSLPPCWKRFAYHPINDLKQIMQFTGLNFGIVVRADSPFKTFKDVINHARQNPKKVTYGTNASGLLYFIMEQIAKKEGVASP